MSTTKPNKCATCGEKAKKICSGCGKVAYCSKEHQRKHWKEHKKVCQRRNEKKKGEKEEVSVTWEDQQAINSFSRFNVRRQNLKASLKEKKQLVVNLEDLAEQIETLLDEDACRIPLGESFVHTSNEDAEEWVEDQLKKARAEEAELQGQFDAVLKEMESLKAVLYAKFGKNITLESNSDVEE